LDTEILLKLPTLRKRHANLASHPFQAAQVYKRLIEALFKHIIGLEADHVMRKSHPAVSQRKEACYGIPIAFVAVTEVQARMSAHLHMLLTADLSPLVLQHYLDDPETMRRLMARLDSMIQAWLPPISEDVAKRVAPEDTTEEPTKLHRDGRLKADCSCIDNIRARACCVALATNVHTHSITCHKGLLLYLALMNPYELFRTSFRTYGEV